MSFSQNEIELSFVPYRNYLTYDYPNFIRFTCQCTVVRKATSELISRG